jgi:hypothetical protein
MYFFKRFAVHLGLGLGYACKDTQACLLDRLGQTALHDDGLDGGQISVWQMPAVVPATVTVAVVAVVMIMIMLVAVLVVVAMPMIVMVVVIMMMPIFMLNVLVVLAMTAAKPYMNLHTLNAAALLWLTLQAKFVRKTQLCKLGCKILWADAKIDHGGKIHVATDSGKAVVIKNLHKTPVKKVQPGRCPVESATVAQQPS